MIVCSQKCFCIFERARFRLLLVAWGHEMVSFEQVREYLLRQLAEQLTIEVEGFDVWEIWLAIHERCPEAARIASDQWTKKELLEEHLRNIEVMRTQNYDWVTNQQLCNQNYVNRWRTLQMQMQEAIAKQKSVELDYRQAW